MSKNAKTSSLEDHAEENCIGPDRRPAEGRRVGARVEPREVYEVRPDRAIDIDQVQGPYSLEVAEENMQEVQHATAARKDQPYQAEGQEPEYHLSEMWNGVPLPL